MHYTAECMGIHATKPVARFRALTNIVPRPLANESYFTARYSSSGVWTIFGILMHFPVLLMVNPSDVATQSGFPHFFVPAVRFMDAAGFQDHAFAFLL